MIWAVVEPSPAAIELDHPRAVLLRGQDRGILGSIAYDNHIVDQHASPHRSDDVANRSFLVERRDDRCDLRHSPS